MKPYIVGITGGSASGKTEFLKRLMGALPAEEICLLSQDNYYKTLDEQPRDHSGVANFDLPESIDHQRFAKDIERLVSGETIRLKEYTYNNPDVVPKELVFRPAPVIIVEGIFVFHFKDVIPFMDLKVFIEAQEHVKLKRRIKRDQVERGYDLEDVLYRYEYHVAPTYMRYIEPYKHDSDIIIPNNSHFLKGLSVVVDHLKTKIQERK